MLTIIPTIDVEGVHGNRPFQQMMLGEIESHAESWGVYRLANIFKQHDVNATFFVDVYEHSLWGKESLKEVCCRLTEMEVDVQLHTHPSWRDDPHDFLWLRKLKREASFLSQNKDFMSKLDLDEQVEVLLHGIELLTEWTGKRPIAHRSGGYSIDGNTVKALLKVGIPLDSSMYYGHEHSKISWSKNKVVEQDGVIELPVTLMDYVFTVPGIGPIYRKSMKTDVDSCSLKELIAYVEQALENNVKVMNLFMHSYSLLKFDNDYQHFSPQPEDEEKLSEFLKYLLNKDNVRVMSCAEMYESYCKKPEEFKGLDYVPQVYVNRKIASLALNKIVNIAHDTFRRFVSVSGFKIQGAKF